MQRFCFKRGQTFRKFPEVREVIGIVVVVLLRGPGILGRVGRPGSGGG